MTTMPPTTSPWPSNSATPRRRSPPRCTVPTFLAIDRRAVYDLQHNVFNVRHVLDVAASAHIILRGGDLEDLSAHVAVAHLDGGYHIRERNVVGHERVRIEIDLVLLHEATDGRDFRHAFHRFQRIAQVPVLQRTQLGEIVFAGVVHEGVFIDPAHAGRIRANHRIDAFGQRSTHRVQIFDDPRARPVNVRAILEDHIDERLPKHRLAAHELHFISRR